MAKSYGVSAFFRDIFSQLALERMLCELASEPIKRGDLILSVIRKVFCMFQDKVIRGRIESMLKDGRLKSATGKTRINKDVKVWTVPTDRGDEAV